MAHSVWKPRRCLESPHVWPIGYWARWKPMQTWASKHDMFLRNDSTWIYVLVVYPKRILILFQHLRRHVSESFNISNRSDILYLWIKHGHSGQFRVENFPQIALLTSPASLVAGQNHPPFPETSQLTSLHRGSVAARNLRTVMLAPG